MTPILPSLPAHDSLAGLFAAPRIHTDDAGVHTDDAGRRYTAVLVGGEVAFIPDGPLTVAAERSMIPLRCPVCHSVLRLVAQPASGLYVLASQCAADAHAERCSGLSGGGRR